MAGANWVSSRCIGWWKVKSVSAFVCNMKVQIEVIKGAANKVLIKIQLREAEPEFRILHGTVDWNINCFKNFLLQKISHELEPVGECLQQVNVVNLSVFRKLFSICGELAPLYKSFSDPPVLWPRGKSTKRRGRVCSLLCLVFCLKV